MVHVHEPLCPGPTQTAMFFKTAPLVGTFHAAGERQGLHLVLARREVAVQEARPALRRQRGRRAHGPQGALGGDLHGAVQRGRGRDVLQGHAVAHRGADGLLHRSPRAPQGPGRAARGHDRAARPRPAVDRRRRSRDRPCCAQRVAGDARIEWLGRISDEEKASRLRGADVFCAPSLHGRVVRRGAARGHGRRHARSWPATCPATPTWPGWAATPCWCRRATAPQLADGLRRVLDRRVAGRPAGGLGRASGPRSCRWSAWPSATWSSTGRSI